MVEGIDRAIGHGLAVEHHTPLSRALYDDILAELRSLRADVAAQGRSKGVVLPDPPL